MEFCVILLSKYTSWKLTKVVAVGLLIRCAPCNPKMKQNISKERFKRAEKIFGGQEAREPSKCFGSRH